MRNIRVPRRAAAAIVLAAVWGVAPRIAIGRQAANDLDPAAKQELKAGQDALEAGRLANAEKSFRQAIKLSHENCSLCYDGLARTLGAQGDTRGGLKAADKVMALAQTDAQRAAAHGLRGFVLSGENGKKKETEAEYRQAVALDGKTAEYHLSLGLTLMRESQDEEGKAEVAEYLSLEPTGRFAADARKLEANPKRAREEMAPEFSMTTLRGETVSLDQFAGRFVVLDFWATWCPACRESLGDLKELTKKYPPERVVLISVSADANEGAWKEFVAKKNMDWYQYRDAKGAIQHTFGIRALPTYVVIDPQGAICQKIQGEDPQKSVVGELKTTLAKMTAE
ncbi:MAG: redoxin family protein [Candidatus Acidiferrales bacterium]